jgi:cytochrome c oxidase cbb3-type subunit 3
MTVSSGVCSAILALSLAFAAAGQQHQPTPLPRQQEAEDPAAIARGRAIFQSSCGFCHGNDATGARAPDLLRSPVVLHDDHGNLLGPLVRNGRPDKGMPSFSTMKDDQVGDIVAFLHHQANAALHSARVPGDYPLPKLLTGNAEAGKAYFFGAGGCSQCHSPAGDLAGVARKFSPIDLQQEMVYPSGKTIRDTAVVTTSDGQTFQGKVVHQDEFSIALICQDGWYRSWPLSQVKADVHDPLQKHRELMKQYTEADIHNLFAYLETLK